MQRERENDQTAIMTVLYKNKAQESVTLLEFLKAYH